MIKQLKSLALASLCCFTAALPAQAANLQDSPYELLNPTFTGGPIARLPVSIIAGRLVITCDVSTAARRLPANLFIDFESPSTLELHNQAANGLKAERGDGSTIPITVHLAGLEFGVKRRQIGDDKYLDRFTKWHSIALGETAVIGTIGSRVLEHFTVTFDLAAGELMLEPKRTSETAPTDLPPGTQTVAIEQRGGLIWIPARVGDAGQSKSGVFALGSGAYDSTIDWDLAAELAHPAGDLSLVRIGDQSALDIAGRLALRPSSVPYAHPDGAIGVLGLGFLEGFRVEIDRAMNQIYITPTATPDFPEDDRALFAASWDDFGPREDPDAIEAWLDKWCPLIDPDDEDANLEETLPRLAPEAARDLLELRLYDGADLDITKRALEWADRTTPKDLRSTGALEIMDLAASTGSAAALVAAGDLGVAAGRDDRYPDAVHKVHAKMGTALFEMGRLDDSWRHLLSAAFGEPENGPVNLGLGRYYEAQARKLLQTGDTRHAMGRFRRAFSRYLQAAIKSESGPAGVEALERVQKQLQAGGGAEAGSFGAELVERLIAGKVRNFGAPSTFEETPENSTGRVVLVEFFTSAFYGDETQGGAIGGGLAQEGLQQHFNDDQVAFLSYHLPVPALDPMVNGVGLRRAEALGISEPNIQVVDGISRVAGAGKWRDAEEIYTRTRKAIESALKLETDFAFELDAQIEDGKISGSLTLDGPLVDEDEEPTATVHLILAERRVIFPGPSGIVIHRMVARTELTPAGGLVATEDPEFVEFMFDGSLAAITAANSATLDGLVENGAGPVRKLSMAFDPAELVLVAFVRDLSTGEVFEAIVVEPELTTDVNNQ